MHRAGIRIWLVALAVVTLAVVAVPVFVHWYAPALARGVAALFTRTDACTGCRPLLASAAITRADRSIVRLQQAADPVAGVRATPLFLARGSDPVLDSLRVGELVAIIAVRDLASAGPVVELVRPDSARQLAPVAGLVIDGGTDPIPVHGLPE